MKTLGIVYIVCVLVLIVLSRAATNDEDCLYLDNIPNYNGTLNVTNRGFTCQSWTSQEPHIHTRTRRSMFRADASVSAAENFCRDPDYDYELWCYTSNPKIRWDYCAYNTCIQIPILQCVEKIGTICHPSTISMCSLSRINNMNATGCHEYYCCMTTIPGDFTQFTKGTPTSTSPMPSTTEGSSTMTTSAETLESEFTRSSIPTQQSSAYSMNDNGFNVYVTTTILGISQFFLFL